MVETIHHFSESKEREQSRTLAVSNSGSLANVNNSFSSFVFSVAYTTLRPPIVSENQSEWIIEAYVLKDECQDNALGTLTFLLAAILWADW